MARYKMTTKRKKAVSGIKKRAKRKHHRIGAVSGGMQMAEFAGGIILGSIAGRESAILLGNAIPSLKDNAMIVGAAQLAGGFLLAKDAKQTFVKGLGYGLMSNGGTTLVVSTGIISGPLAYRLNGLARNVGNIRFIAGQTSRIGDLGQSDLAFTAGLNGIKRLPNNANKSRNSIGLVG